MSMNEEDDYTTDLLEKFDNLEIPLPVDDEDTSVPTVECDAEDHPDESTLREGNYVTALVVNDDDGWAIENTCCKHCSIKDIYERADSDVVTAVVEGLLEPTPDHVSDEKPVNGLYLEHATVWDIHLPQAT